MLQRSASLVILAIALIGAFAIGNFTIGTIDSKAPSAPPSPDTASIAVNTNKEKPRVDVVFVLDNTGSMGGLLEGAKRKIWSIAEHLVSGQPQPDVRIGLIGYRDRTDSEVITVTPLTRDLDGVQQALMAMRARGGGDTPEDVNQALVNAIRQQPWSQGKRVLRLIYLVGDAPPHDDYAGPNSVQLAQEAQKKGIVVNAIRCGGLQSTETAFIQIAQHGGGDYSSIAQDGGMQMITTPFDDELSTLNGKLSKTMLGYGVKKERDVARSKMATRGGLSKPASAAAAVYSAKSGRMNNEDLVTQMADGTVSMETIEKEKLPEEMQKLSKEEIAKRVEEVKATRQQLQKRILELSKKREEYLKQEAKTGESKSEFDDEFKESLRKKAKSIDVLY